MWQELFFKQALSTKNVSKSCPFWSLWDYGFLLMTLHGRYVSPPEPQKTPRGPKRSPRDPCNARPRTPNRAPVSKICAFVSQAESQMSAFWTKKAPIMMIAAYCTVRQYTSISKNKTVRHHGRLMAETLAGRSWLIGSLMTESSIASNLTAGSLLAENLIAEN